jgi:hypothetical protein
MRRGKTTHGLFLAVTVSWLTASQGFAILQRVPSFQDRAIFATTTGTDISITIPPYFDSEDPELPYPSVLHSIHIKSVLSDDEAKKALEIARSYAAATGRWERPDSDRHSTYATCDFPVEDSMELQSYLENDLGFTNIIWTHLNECYGIDYEDMTYLDFFCSQYEAKSYASSVLSTTTMDRLEAHRDGSLLSFTVTLTPPDEFKGGGTFFDSLKNSTDEGNGVLRPTRAGDAVLHCGKLLHGADVVTEGSRTVLVGFVDVAAWTQRPGALSNACCEWGRMDVATKRYQRQVAKATSLGKNGWSINHSKWLPKTDLLQDRGRSYLNGFSPAFLSVKRRAEEGYQRQRRREAEDLLLRTILLSDEEKDGSPPLFPPDITIL